MRQALYIGISTANIKAPVKYLPLGDDVLTLIDGIRPHREFNHECYQTIDPQAASINSALRKLEFTPKTL